MKRLKSQSVIHLKWKKRGTEDRERGKERGRKGKGRTNYATPPRELCSKEARPCMTKAPR